MVHGVEQHQSVQVHLYNHVYKSSIMLHGSIRGALHTFVYLLVLAAVPLPPVNVQVRAVNTSHFEVTWEYSQGISRECELVYFRQETQFDSNVRSARILVILSEKSCTSILKVRACNNVYIILQYIM